MKRCEFTRLMSIKTFGMERELKNNLLLKTELSSVGLILYQDAFEVVNPLGSEKNKKNIYSIYSTLTDILLQNRSTINQMQLVFLCREQVFRYLKFLNHSSRTSWKREALC